MVNRTQSQAGLSLIEVLIALAITALASLALFQSLTGWVTIGGKTAGAAERSLNRLIVDNQFRQAVGDLTFAWPEAESKIFTGTQSGFSGLTGRPLHRDDPALQQVTIDFVKDRHGTALRYAAGETGWVLQEFPGGSGFFSYLGANGRWYDVWPPAETPEPGPFDDATYYETPQVPTAIRLTVTQTRGTRDVPIKTVIASVASNPFRPLRDSDTNPISQSF